MTPTAEQLTNRKKLAQEVRHLVEGQRLLPTQGTYLSYAPPVGGIDSPCFSCAVGSVIAAAAALTFPAMHLKVGASLIFSNHGIPNGDFHTSLADLVGFTFTEVVAFEAAFMGAIMLPSLTALENMEGKGYLDLKVQPLGFTGIFLWRENLRNQLGLVDLINDALEWNHWVDADDRGTILALMTLLESWETQPISYKRKTEEA